MNVLTLYKSERLMSYFIELYARERSLEGDDCRFIKMNNIGDLKNFYEQRIADYLLIELDFILTYCTKEDRSYMFETGKEIYVIAFGDHRQYLQLSSDEQSCINLFYNSETFTDKKSAECNKKGLKLNSRTTYLAYSALSKFAIGTACQKEEMEAMNQHLKVWHANYRVCIILLDFQKTPAETMRRIGAKQLEALVDIDDKGEKWLINYVQGNQSTYYGMLSYASDHFPLYSDTFVRNYCRSLRVEMKSAYGSEIVLTTGISSSCFETVNIPFMFMDATNAEYYYVYEGLGKDYYYDECRFHRVAFRQNEHIMELQRCLRSFDIESICQEVNHLFDEVDRARLLKQEFQTLLMEIMSLAYNLCVSENLKLEEVNERRTGQIEYSFIYEVESLKREKESFIGYISRIVRKIGERKKIETQYSARIRKAIKYINDYYPKKITLKGLSKELGVSPNYISTTFKNETGRTLMQYINYMRIEKAKILITNPRYKADEISELVGYSDTSYFCTVFKKYTGQSITNYRKKYIEE